MAVEFSQSLRVFKEFEFFEEFSDIKQVKAKQTL